MAIAGRHLPRAATMDWLTPRSIVDELGPFDMDPCTPHVMPWRTAARMLTSDDDGLKTQWIGRVWLNPPYGRDIGAWVRKLAEHGDGIALTFARVDTAWWARWVWPTADAVLFPVGRITFCLPTGDAAGNNSGGPSAFIAYGERNVTSLRRLACVRGALITRTGGWHGGGV